MSSGRTLSRVISVEEQRHLFLTIADGDKAAFEEFYNLTSRYVWGYLIKIIVDKDIAIELLQDIYISFWNNRAGLRHTLYPFDYTIRKTSRAVYQYMLKKSGKEMLKSEQLALLIPEIYRDEDTDAESAEILGRIELAVRTLSAKEQEIFRASRYAGISLHDIAIQQNVSVREIRRIDERAMDRVRQMLLQG